MTRPLRIEFPGAIYHVTSRGNARRKIYLDDEDREAFLATMAWVVERFGWICHAYCLMGNHFHLVVETPDANLVAGKCRFSLLTLTLFGFRPLDSEQIGQVGPTTHFQPRRDPLQTHRRLLAQTASERFLRAPSNGRQS